MSATEVPATSWLRPADVFTLLLSFGALYVATQFVSAFYEAFYGPLSKFPGPKLRAFSIFPQINTIWQGREHSEYIELHDKYGPVVRVAPRELSFSGGPQGFKDVYGFKKAGVANNDKSDKFYFVPQNKVAGLIFADDVNHARQRRTVSHAFSDKSLRLLEPMLKKWAEKMKTKLAERAARDGEADMLKFYNCTTFDIMGDLCFSEGLNMLEDGDYSPWVKTIFSTIKRGSQLRAIKLLGSLAVWVIQVPLRASPTIRRKGNEHWAYTTTRVDRRLARAPAAPDLWSKIIEKSHGPDALTLAEHHSIASIFMMAGTETTATALSGTTFHLLRNRAALARLTAELRAAFPAGFAALSLDALAKLPYLHAVLREGMRLYPPVPIGLPRVTPRGGTVVCGEFVPEHVIVSVHQLASSSRPEHFADPAAFAPERWLGEDPRFANDQLDASEPFSLGPRNCLGKNLAWHELRLLLATVMVSFDLELVDTRTDWIGLQETYVLWEKVPLVCKIKEVAPA